MLLEIGQIQKWLRDRDLNEDGDYMIPIGTTPVPHHVSVVDGKINIGATVKKAKRKAKGKKRYGPSNADRVTNARAMIAIEENLNRGEPLQSLLEDAFSDLRHLAAKENLNFEGAVEMSELNYEGERHDTH